MELRKFDSNVSKLQMQRVFAEPNQDLGEFVVITVFRKFWFWESSFER